MTDAATTDQLGPPSFRRSKIAAETASTSGAMNDNAIASASGRRPAPEETQRDEADDDAAQRMEPKCIGVGARLCGWRSR